MAVDRSLLAQALGRKGASRTYLDASGPERALLTGQQISQYAMDPNNFGSGRAGGIGLAAQLVTAGAGAFTQYKAQKDINERELASQAQFAKQFPHLADLAPTLSSATRQAYTLEALKKDLKTAEPQSSYGKLTSDYNAGLIDEPTYRSAIKKETSFAPDSAASGGATGALIRDYQRETGADYKTAFGAVKGLTSQGVTYDNNGTIVPIPGYKQSTADIKGSQKQSETLATKSSDKLIDLGEKADEANMALTNNMGARKLLDSGMYTGAGAKFKLGLGKALQTAGVSLNDDPIANTEAFAALRAQEVGRQIKLFGSGTGLSDADREYTQNMAAGKIDLTDKSIRKILDISDLAANNVIGLYNKKSGQLPEAAQQYAPQVAPNNTPDNTPAAAPANRKPLGDIFK